MAIVPYPGRSPLVLADVLQDIIRNKIVCDIGCSAGDLMLVFKKYARDVVGVEWTPERFPTRADEGLNIIYGDARFCTIPPADVYYVWVSPFFLPAILERIRSGLVILGDYGENPSVEDKIGSLSIRFPFTENGVSSYWRIIIINKNGL